MPLTPEQRTLRARLAAHALHSKVDSREHTRPAREAQFRRFEDEVDPERVLPEGERRKRAEHAQRAYMASLALKSSQARSRRAGRDGSG